MTWRFQLTHNSCQVAAASPFGRNLYHLYVDFLASSLNSIPLSPTPLQTISRLGFIESIWPRILRPLSMGCTVVNTGCQSSLQLLSHLQPKLQPLLQPQPILPPILQKQTLRKSVGISLSNTILHSPSTQIGYIFSTPRSHSWSLVLRLRKYCHLLVKR